MATVTKSQTAPSNRLVPKPILQQLRALRRKLTTWIFVKGLGRWLLILLGVLLADMLIDRMFKMDFAQRVIMLLVILAIAGAVLFWRLVRPLMYRPTTDALIYEVEDKNSELNESLISAVQLARQEDLNALGFSPTLAAATIQKGVENAQQLDFGKTIDQSKNVSNWLMLLAGVGLFVMLGVGVNQNSFLATWFNRNVMLGSSQWPQGTYLSIAGVENGKLILPRGIDHRQLVEITEASTVRDVDISIEIDGPNGTSVHSMKSTGKNDGREHAFMFHNVSSTFRFRAKGGDETTEWVNVGLVEPPSVGQLELIARMPDYTGIDSLPLVGNGPHSVLVGSQLVVKAEANKALTQCVVRLGDLSFELAPVDGPTVFSGMIPGAGKALAGGDYVFQLEDETGLRSIRPTKFGIAIKEDAPPKISGVSLLGISGLVVPRARIPVSFSAKDEFAISKLEFDCLWKSGEVDGESENGTRVDLGPLSTVPGQRVNEVNDVIPLDLLPLNILPGSSFRFTLQATDNKPETPGVGVSQEFLLRVVTDEELRADLLRREIEQRKAFEQAYNDQLELMAEVQAVVAMKPRPSQDKVAFDSDREKRLIALTREQKGVGTSLNRIADRFEEFLVEVQNNRLDEQENELAPDQRIEKRFDEGVIQPTRILDQEFVSLATRHLDDCRRVAGQESELLLAVEPTVAIQQEILARMKRILASMMDSENFQEVINKLLEIEAAERRLIKESKDRAKPDGIFDD